MPNDPNKESKEVQDLKTNLNVTKDFLDFIEKIDAMPDMKKARFTETRSLYQAVSKGRGVDDMEKVLADFFGPPAKPAGKSLSLLLRRNPSIKYLDGIREEQILFIRKVQSGFYYGALWPWRRDPMQITVHLGFLSPKMSEKDFKKLEDLVKSKVMHEKVFERLDAGTAGQVEGISLASFLQMAAMEKITCTLKVKKEKDIGYLHLFNGDLIAAGTGPLKNKQAAYKIISWENTVIDIEPAGAEKENQINQPIVNILLEAAKAREKEGPRPKKKMTAAKGQKQIAAADEDAVIDLEDEVALAVDEALKPIEKRGTIKRKLFTKKAALAVVAVIVIAAGAFMALRFVKARQVESEYQNALAMAEGRQGEKAKTTILQGFIDSHQQSKLAKKAEEKIAEIHNLFARKDYEATMKTVQQLAQGKDYEKMTAVYQAYLKKHPRSLQAPAVRQKIKAISLLADNSDYDELIKSAQSGNVERIYSYVQYLEKYPNGKHRDDVSKLISNMSEEYYLFLNKEIAVCSKLEDWEKCAQLCDEFNKIYPDHRQASKIKNVKEIIEQKLEGQKILAALNTKAQQAGHDYKTAKQVYYDYLSAHPDADIKDKIRTEINVLKEKEQLAWLQKEREKIALSLKESAGRFVGSPNDTVKDTKTGLMWCMFDSRQALKNCLNYEAAQKYVKDLRTGGYKDWRLPKESELTNIYKKEPFFPLREAKWYWTSKSYPLYSDGWQQMVHIVTTKRETVWKSEQANARECGAVQAVRP